MPRGAVLDHWLAGERCRAGADRVRAAKREPRRHSGERREPRSRRASLRADTDVAGLAALFEGVLLGLSIQALDGATPACLDAAVTGALTVWDAHLSSRPESEAP